MDLQESYKVLELEKTHCLQEVKQAYRDIVFVWHPDRLEHNERIKKKAEKKLQQINLAYEILTQHLSGKLPDFVNMIIEPNFTEVNYHESKVFTAFGVDRKGKKTEMEQVKWESSGGTIYQDGLFFADDEMGNYTITASFSTLKTEAKVKIIKKESIPEGVSDSKVSFFQSIKNKLKTKITNYIKTHPLITKIVSWKKSVINLLALMKWVIWLSLGWLIMNNNYLSPENFNLSTRFTSILFISWLIAIISPSLVINFGINSVDSDSTANTKAKVSVFYSMLISIFLGMAMATSPLLMINSLNSVQNWIVGASGMTMIFTLCYPQGSIMASIINNTPRQNRFTASMGCLILALLTIAFIGLCR
jgi:hypothetical protein